MVATMASATTVAPAAGPTAEEDDEGRLARAYLGGGWAVNDCEPTEEELEYRQERARPAQQAKPLWLQRPAALLRMPENASVRCPSARSRNWSSSWPRWTPRARSPPSSHHGLSSPNNPSRRRSPAGRWRSAWPAGALTAL